MRSHATWWLVVVPAVALAGCLGAGEDAGGDDVAPTSQTVPTVTEKTGAIQGVVTDNAVQPVAGATVTTAELGAAAVTASDGSYVINDLLPGRYTITVAKDGLVPATETADVRAGEVTSVDFVLVHLVSDAPYVQTRELTGFMACGVATSYNFTSIAPQPPAPVPDPRFFFITWTICEDVEFALGQAGVENGTSDESYWEMDLDPPLHTLVYEVEWDAGNNPLAEQLFAFGGFGLTHEQVSRWVIEAIRVSGPSPLYQRVDHEKLLDLQANVTAACDDGQERSCGHAFVDEGWDFGTAVLPHYECLSEQASACGAVQQVFTVYATGFYNSKAPEGWSILSSPAD